MRILGDYLRYHKKAILLFFVCVCIFSTVFFLSRIPLDAVLYGGLLCLIAAGVIAAYDFRKYAVQHRQLQRLTRRSKICRNLETRSMRIIPKLSKNFTGKNGCRNPAPMWKRKN